MQVSLWFWIAFNAIIVVLLLLDLTIWDRDGRRLGFKQAVVSWMIWVALAAGFAVFIHFWQGPAKSLEFVTGYVIEEALSVDNLFIFILLFSYFKVPPELERTVLFWGIIGALIMRGGFIFAGVALVRRFPWILYAFGAFLVYSGFKLLTESEEEEVDPSHNVVLRLCRRFLSITKDYEGKRFFVLRDGRRFATPLFIVLVVVETTDILFATDSIPAVLAITRETFIVYTSNVFAILGLRSIFFALSGLMKVFHYLNYGVAVVLMFIGAKMLLAMKYEIPTWVSLVVIGAVLGLSVLASKLFPEKPSANSEAPLA